MVVFYIPTPEEREGERARQVIHDFARSEGMDLGFLRINTKRRDLVQVRREAAAAAYRSTAASVSEIARILDRNHSTIREGLRLMGMVV